MGTTPGGLKIITGAAGYGIRNNILWPCTELKVRRSFLASSASGMVPSKLISAGVQYLNLGRGWNGGILKANRRHRTSPNFRPNMRPSCVSGMVPNSLISWADQRFTDTERWPEGNNNGAWINDNMHQCCGGHIIATFFHSLWIYSPPVAVEELNTAWLRGPGRNINSINFWQIPRSFYSQYLHQFFLNCANNAKAGQSFEPWQQMEYQYSSLWIQVARYCASRSINPGLWTGPQAKAVRIHFRDVRIVILAWCQQDLIYFSRRGMAGDKQHTERQKHYQNDQP